MRYRLRRQKWPLGPGSPGGSDLETVLLGRRARSSKCSLSARKSSIQLEVRLTFISKRKIDRRQRERLQSKITAIINSAMPNRLYDEFSKKRPVRRMYQSTRRSSSKTASRTMFLPIHVLISRLPIFCLPIFWNSLASRFGAFFSSAMALTSVCSSHIEIATDGQCISSRAIKLLVIKCPL